MYALTALLAFVATLGAPASVQDAAAPFGFAMAPPEGWHPITSQGLANNLGKLKITPAELQTLLTNHGESVIVLAFMKYQPAAHPGLIPKIQVSLRRNPAKTFDGFFKMIARATDQVKTFPLHFKLTEAPRVVEVGGRHAVFFSSTVSVETKDIGTLNGRSRTYAVPNGDTFFQIVFTDGPEDDCTALFDQLVSTIRFH